ncbi:MAG: glutathione S-transferase family protein [Proteobacteria bacterium]|nr:glutathione S-transferase family protein [Pseudomonadota bacterium]
MKLYYNPISTYSQKVLIAFYEKELDFDPEIIDLMNPDAGEKYRDVYPMGKVPCLQLDDGHIIPESSIIVEYIDPLATPTLIKGDADETRRIRFKDRMFDLYLNDAVVTLLFQGMKPDSEQDPERIEKAKFHIATTYSFMENEFANQPYANGEEFMMSDCSAAPGLFYAENIAPFAEHKNISAYWERLKSRPSIQRVHEEAAPILAAFMAQSAG